MPLPKGTPSSRIKANIAKRQSIKKKWDKHCKYSAEDELPDNLQVEGLNADTKVDLAAESGNDNWVRLLDEGVVVDGEGWPWGVIPRGLLQATLDAMPNNFKGYIDKGHDREIFLGEFTKKDLRIVDTENDRQALEVNLHLDHELYAVRDLIRENAHHALSVEMWSSVEMYLDGKKVTGEDEWEGWLVPVFDELKIEGFGVVRNPKSAYSVKDDMLIKAAVEEGDNMNKDEKKKQELEALQAAADKETDDAEKKGDGTEGDDNTEGGDGVTDPATATGMNAEEGEKTEDGKEDEDKEEGGDAEKTDLSQKDYDALKEAILGLQNSIKELSAENKSLKSQLEANKQKELSATDRVAELLGLAQATEPTAAESGDNTPSTNTKADLDADILEGYKKAFAANEQ